MLNLQGQSDESETYVVVSYPPPPPENPAFSHKSIEYVDIYLADEIYCTVLITPSPTLLNVNTVVGACSESSLPGSVPLTD